MPASRCTDFPPDGVALPRLLRAVDRILARDPATLTEIERYETAVLLGLALEHRPAAFTLMRCPAGYREGLRLKLAEVERLLSEGGAS